MTDEYAELSPDSQMEDIWNVIYLPLPANATKEFVASIYSDAEHCYEHARKRYHDPNGPIPLAFEPYASPHYLRGTTEQHVDEACKRLREIEARWPDFCRPMGGKQYNVQTIEEIRSSPGFEEPEREIGDDRLSANNVLKLAGIREMTLDELESDPWNAIYLPLPDAPTGEVVERVHMEAHHCYQGARERFNEPRSTEVKPYEPSLSQYSAAATTDGHLDAAFRRVREIEERWPNYLDKLDGRHEVQSLQDCRKEREARDRADTPDEEMPKELDDRAQSSLNRRLAQGERPDGERRGHATRDNHRRIEADRSGRGR